MKKIITMTMVKNESDIIETFVRYTLNYAETMYFIDNGSTDGTLEILRELMAEGLHLIIYEEAKIFYEQFLVENYYMNKIAREEKFDFLIPLDADEFLVSDGNLDMEFDRMDETVVNVIQWRTYCITGEDNNNDDDILKRIRYYRDETENENVFTKVIIPYKVLAENNLVLKMGHHDVDGISEMTKKKNPFLFLAHFPVRSYDQLRLKIYQGTVAQLMSSYHGILAFHWRKLLLMIKNGGLDIYRYSREYALSDNDAPKSVRLIEKRVDTSWCDKTLLRKYDSLIDRSIEKNLVRLLERVCLTYVIRETSTNTDNAKIIIFGTGAQANELIKCIMGSILSSVICFMDSDLNKEFSIFYGKIVVGPEYVRFLDFDKIIIASSWYEDIKLDLLKRGVPRDRILSVAEYIAI